MHAFELYIDDDRYSAPSLVIVEAGSPQRVRVIAHEYLQRSPHFSRVEVYLGSEHLFGLKTSADGQSGASRRRQPAPGRPSRC
jgi:hypothetical protein